METQPILAARGLTKTYGKVGPDEQEQSQRLTDSLFNQPKRDEPDEHQQTA